MNTYTITVPFLLSSHSVSLWVTVVVSNKLQVSSLWNPEIPTHIHNDANTGSLISGISWHWQTGCQPVISRLSGNLLVWSNICYLAKADKPHVSQKWDKPLETWKLLWGRVEWSNSLLAGISDKKLVQLPKGKSESLNMSGPVYQLCDLGRFTADTQHMFIW